MAEENSKKYKQWMYGAMAVALGGVVGFYVRGFRDTAPAVPDTSAASAISELRLKNDKQASDLTVCREYSSKLEKMLSESEIARKEMQILATKKIVSVPQEVDWQKRTSVKYAVGDHASDDIEEWIKKDFGKTVLTFTDWKIESQELSVVAEIRNWTELDFLNAGFKLGGFTLFVFRGKVLMETVPGINPGVIKVNEPFLVQFHSSSISKFQSDLEYRLEIHVSLVRR